MCPTTKSLDCFKCFLLFLFNLQVEIGFSEGERERERERAERDRRREMGLYSVTFTLLTGMWRTETHLLIRPGSALCGAANLIHH